MQEDEKYYFMSIGSGSSGNCYFLGKKNAGLLIDAGLPLRIVSKALKQQGVEIDRDVRGVLITHDHADHIRSVGMFAARYFLPIYATEKVFTGIEKSRYVEDKIPLSSVRVISTNNPFSIFEYNISVFHVPHDSRENVGYHIANNRFRFTLATDIGHITSDISKFISTSTHIVIEANYDKEMLLNGSYPNFLKERVSGKFGHLSNIETANCIAQCFNPEMKHIWLCHLSKENNHPDLCLKTIENRLYKEGIRVGKDIQIDVLKRTIPSALFEL